MCGISPALRPLSVGLAAHSSTSGRAGGRERAGSGRRMRRSASPRATLPAELLLRSSQNLKPPSPAGSRAAPLPPSRPVPQHPAAAASPNTEGRSLKPRLVRCRWEDDERAQKPPASSHSACVCARTYPGRCGAAPVGMPRRRVSPQPSFRMESRLSGRFFSWDGTALVAISFQISLFPGSHMFPCSSQRDGSSRSLIPSSPPISYSSHFPISHFILFPHFLPHVPSLLMMRRGRL